jgi:hypothetical protein
MTALESSGWTKGAFLKKKVVFLVFFLGCGLLAAAQSYRETKIYIPPIDGVGYIDDMAWFYKKITGEITMQYRTLGKARLTSDYVITGRVMPLEGEEIEMPPGSENDEYILYVELFDNALGETIGDQFITYTDTDKTTEEALSVIIYNLLSALPDAIELYSEADNWRNKFVYFNPVFIWTPKVYNASYQSANIAGVGAEVVVDIHILRFLALKAGAEVSQDWVAVYGADSSYSDMILDFPFGVAVVLRPLAYLMVEPYLGGSVNFSLLGITQPNRFSWTARLTASQNLQSCIFRPCPILCWRILYRAYPMNHRHEPFLFSGLRRNMRA